MRMSEMMTGPLFVLALSVLPITADWAQEESTSLPSDAAPYCGDLKRVAALAATKDRFVSITGKPREGSFLDTSLPLTGWKDCSLYGPRTYTCDSEARRTSEDAEKAQATTLQAVQACLGDAWAEAKDRSSPSYVVLHDARTPISITLSTDENERKEHVVRLIVFRRSN